MRQQLKKASFSMAMELLSLPMVSSLARALESKPTLTQIVLRGAGAGGAPAPDPAPAWRCRLAGPGEAIAAADAPESTVRLTFSASRSAASPGWLIARFDCGVELEPDCWTTCVSSCAISWRPAILPGEYCPLPKTIFGPT